MTTNAFNIADFGMGTVSLAGGLGHRLDAIRRAGFSQVTLAAGDLVNHPEGVDAAIRLVDASGLRVTGFRILRDFEGLTGRQHDYKVDIAKSLLEMCRAVGSRLLLIGSSTFADASGDPDHLARDLRKLAMLALPLGVRIGYEGLPSGRHVSDFNAAWDIVCRADAPNLGLVVDAFQALVAQAPLEDIELLDPDKIFLLQLADFMESGERVRVFPGEGAHSEQLAEWVLAFAALGYRGDYVFEVFNDDYRQIPLDQVAERARRSALWLGEDVLRLSTPLPGQMRLRRD